MNLNPKAEQPVTDMQDTAEIENADKGPAIGFPGPWNDKDEENNDDPGQLVIYIRDANSGFVAEVRSYPEYEEELPESRKRSRDIAALIAAAPELLEALTEILGTVTTTDEEERTAIDKGTALEMYQEIISSVQAIAIRAINKAKGEHQ